jgi:hypothetical protein
MRLCWDCWRDRKDGERRVEFVRVEVPVLADAELLRGAIALTHPDRHPPERQELANRITAGLLDLLKKAGRPQ